MASGKGRMKRKREEQKDTEGGKNKLGKGGREIKYRGGR